MTSYQQSNSLSTDTNAPISGTGGSTPESAAGNDGYAVWPWEVILATVLGIEAPDRGEVNGQPWLTVLSDGQSDGGAHLIWTADWNTSPDSGATSIHVYLNPALYTSGGAWDRFLNAPPEAMSGVTQGNYAGLPLNPGDFYEASLSVGAVRNWMATAADDLAALYQTASSGPAANFQGALAGVAADLLGDLGNVMTSLHEQMTSPVSYDASLTAAGDAATQFLTSLMSAYTSWTQLPGHTPLGAVVQVLEEIATQDAAGAYVIPDPQNTPYGDLTVSGSWAGVEQAAKDLWANLLTGGSPDFAGLDPLGQAALSNLVDEFATTTSAVVPVLGPATPPLTPNPVPTVSNPDPNPVRSDYSVGPGTGNSTVGQIGNGPDGVGVGGVGGTGGVGSQVAVGQAVFAAGQNGPGGLQPGATGNSVDSAAAAGTAPLDSPATGPAAGDIPVAVGLFSGLSGAIGADPGGQRSTSEVTLAADLASGLAGFTGTVGRTREAVTGLGAQQPGSRRGQQDRQAVRPAGRQAPVPGFSLGRDPAGPVLRQLAVPVVMAKPPAVTASPINSQLVPASGGASGPGGLTASSASAGPGALARSAAAPVPVPAETGESALAAASAGGTAGPGAGAGGPLILPPGAMGMGGAQVGGGLQRLAYLPEEPEYWGTAPAIPSTSLGAGECADLDESAEPEFIPVMTTALGSGAGTQDESVGEHIADRRMP